MEAKKSMTTTRTEFLARVKKALDHVADQPAPSGVAAHPVVRDDLVRQVQADTPQRLERWIQLAKKNGMVIEQVTAAGIPDAIRRCLGKHQIKKALLNLGTFEGQIPVRET